MYVSMRSRGYHTYVYLCWCYDLEERAKQPWCQWSNVNFGLFIYSFRLFEFRKVVSDRRLCFPLVNPNHQVVITKESNTENTLLLEGHFLSPFNEYLPDLLPKEARKAHFQILLPKKWESNHYKPVCLHLAGTGDHVRKEDVWSKVPIW